MYPTFILFWTLARREKVYRSITSFAKKDSRILMAMTLLPQSSDIDRKLPSKCRTFFVFLHKQLKIDSLKLQKEWKIRCYVNPRLVLLEAIPFFFKLVDYFRIQNVSLFSGIFFYRVSLACFIMKYEIQQLGKMESFFWAAFLVYSLFLLLSKSKTDVI